MKRIKISLWTKSWNLFFREVIDYEGGRDLDALIKFVESGGTEGNEASEDDEDYDDVSWNFMKFLSAWKLMFTTFYGLNNII